MTDWGVREPDGTIQTDREWTCPADVMRATHGRGFSGPVDVVYREDWKSAPEAPRGVSEGLVAPGRTRLPVTMSQDAEEPRRGYPNDAGLDLVVSEGTTIFPGRFVDVPCGISVQLPDWAWGMITGRSSTLRKRGLLVNQGVIDAGYRGPLFAGVWNMTDQPVVVRKGERIAQLIVIENVTRDLDVVLVDSLEPSDRGHSGFGSTGK